MLESKLANSHLDEKKKNHAVIYSFKRTELMRLRRRRLTVNSFESIKVIGRGAFGEVHLARIKEQKMFLL